MSKSLVLAEKPSVGRDIARVLQCNQNGNGYFEGSKYIVTWALGHLVTLADPESYDSKYQKWKLEDLPMLPEPLNLEIIPNTRKQYNTVKQLLVRKDVDQIIIATDAGREGELVARWILEKSKVKKPVKRLWVSSVTDQAIREGFNKLKDGKAYENLYMSARARSEADWYVGMNATRALTTKFNAQLSCGRVQTPTLAMIADREAEIQKFRSQEFYGITAMAKGIHMTWTDFKSQSTRSFDKERVENILSVLKGKTLKISEIEKQNKKSYSPGLYDLTELQREANKRFGFSAKQTLNAMQKLYEEHKILTYPRTDSRFISKDIVPTLKDRIRACGTGEFGALAGQILRSPITTNKSFVDDFKVSDHHAIIPTEQSVMLNRLSVDERKIYDLVVKRFLAVLLPPFEYEQTKIVARLGEETFKAKGKRVIHIGWKAAYNNSFDDDDHSDELKDQMLPLLKKGDVLECAGLKLTSGSTQPPAYHTEGTLLTAMEKPNKNMTCGIGTVATRADIIEKLINSFLIEKKGQHLHITSKGKQLLELVPKELKTPELTAEWESKLELIASGNLKKESFMKEIKNYTKSSVSEIKNSTAQFKHDNLSREKCPECGKFLLEVNGKKGKMLVCQDRECGYRKSLAVVTNARCPVCHKKLELRGEGENKTFFCKCGHREKLEAFNNRRKEASGKGSAKDVQKFLEEQKKEATYESPMAEALRKLKLK
ncbi:MAG: DNA topoisomerase III [Clostridia bacterium]|nr:DNA topoisomerase III [Clostridia bacterium]